MTRLVVLADNLGEGPGFSYVWENAPFTGLAVDLRGDGSVESATEIADGRHHGYGVDFDTKGRPRYVAQYHYHRVHGLLAEWDEQGQLIHAERYEEDFLTQELEMDPETGVTTMVDRAENAAAITAARSHLKVQSPPMIKSVYELLADFERAVPNLHKEVEQGYGVV